MFKLTFSTISSLVAISPLMISFSSLIFFIHLFEEENIYDCNSFFSPFFMEEIIFSGDTGIMVLLDWDSVIGAHVRSNLWVLTSPSRFIRYRAVTNRIFLFKRLFFLHYNLILFGVPKRP